MKLKSVAIVSVGLNIALVTWLVIRRPAQSQAHVVSSVPTATAPATAPVAAVAPAFVPAARTNFHWSQVESADYLAYIANLRAIGCPEETIRDIIIADVNKLFAPRYATLGADAPELKWWGRFDKRKPVRAGLAARLRELNDEKKALLVRLLGPGAAGEFAFVDTGVATVREESAFAFLPEGKRAAVHELVGRFQALREWSETQWKGLPTDERNAKEKALFAARAAELAAILSPEEMGEFALRDSPLADELRERYGMADLTEAEFRRLHELRRTFDEQHPDATADDWKRLDSEVVAALGPERHADVQRQNDRTWRALQDLAPERNLSPDAMQQAYAIKQEYQEKMVAALRQMFADPQQNPQPVRDIAAEMDRRLETVLGPDGVKHLDRLDALPRLVVKTDGKQVSYSFSKD